MTGGIQISQTDKRFSTRFLRRPMRETYCVGNALSFGISGQLRRQAAFGIWRCREDLIYSDGHFEAVCSMTRKENLKRYVNGIMKTMGRQVRTHLRYCFRLTSSNKAENYPLTRL